MKWLTIASKNPRIIQSIVLSIFYRFTKLLYTINKSLYIFCSYNFDYELDTKFVTASALMNISEIIKEKHKNSDIKTFFLNDDTSMAYLYRINPTRCAENVIMYFNEHWSIKNNIAKYSLIIDHTFMCKESINDELEQVT